MKKFFSLIAICAAAVTVSAEVIDLQSPSAWQKNSALTAKDGILTVTGKQQLLTAEQITVDPAKTYTFTAAMRCVDGKKSVFMPIVLQYDAAKNTIGTGRAKTIDDTFTQLLAPVKRGDKSLLVKDAKLWPQKELLVIAFNTKEDYSDLPTPRVNWNTIESIVPENGAFRVNLKSIVPFNAAPGGIRLHRNGPLYMFPAGGRQTGDNWQTITGKITGMERKNFTDNSWAPGAVKARFGLQVNFRNIQGVTEIKDMKIIVE